MSAREVLEQNLAHQGNRRTGKEPQMHGRYAPDQNDDGLSEPEPAGGLPFSAVAHSLVDCLRKCRAEEQSEQQPFAVNTPVFGVVAGQQCGAAAAEELFHIN